MLAVAEGDDRRWKGSTEQAKADGVDGKDDGVDGAQNDEERRHRERIHDLLGRDWVGEAELEQRRWERERRKDILKHVREAREGETRRVEELRKRKPGKREVPEDAEEARHELKVGGRKDR